MALEVGKPADKRERRSIGAGILGVILVVAAGYMTYDLLLQHSHLATASTASIYDYSLRQSVDTNVSYMQSSFFPDGPTATDKAYVTDLTKDIDATFHYQYRASEAITLTYRYDVKAEVHAQYFDGGDSTEASNIWSKTFQLSEPATTTATTKSFDINQAVTVPYSTYRKLIDQLQAAFTLPINSEVVVTFTMQVSGMANGTAFTDTKVSSVTAPVDQQLYTLAVKFDKQDEKQVVPKVVEQEQGTVRQYQTIAAIALGVLGIAALVYGMRRRIFKTAYQRELDRIYRYHDGIIIHARRPSMVTDKNTIPVRSFDDILNIEEETKQPVIAYPLGDEATQFMIMKDDVMYTYTLGKELLDHEDTELKQAQESVEESAPKPPKKYRKVQ